MGMLGGCSDSEQGLSTYNCIGSMNKVESVNVILFQSPLEAGHISAVSFLGINTHPLPFPLLSFPFSLSSLRYPPPTPRHFSFSA